MESAVEVFRTTEDLLKIRSAWELMQWHPNADLDFFLTVVAARNEVERPHVIVIKESGAIKSIIVGRVEAQKIKCKIGYSTVYTVNAHALNIVYGGFLGERRNWYAEIIARELIDTVNRGEVDVININFLDSNAALFDELQWRHDALVVRQPMQCHWKIVLPDSYEKLMQSRSSKSRKNLKRYNRSLETDFAGNMAFTCFGNAQDIRRVCDDVESIASQTYHRRLGVGFVANDEIVDRLTLWSAKGCLRVYLLYLNDIPCSFLIGTVYGTTLHLDYMGYAPSYKQYELGTITLYKMIQTLYADDENRHICEIDFGLGDASYKQSMCNASWSEGSLYVFKKNVANYWRKTIIDTINWTNTYAKQVTKAMSLDGKLKKYFREYASENVSGKEQRHPRTKL